LFSPSSQIFFLTNSGTSALTWSLVNTSAWLNASTTGGTLAAGGTNGVTISLTSTANGLAIGTYAATVKLTNWNTHVVQGLQFTLQALQPLTVTPATGFTATGPVAGPFSPSSSSFQLTNIGGSPLTWSLVNTSAWLAVSSGGTLAANAATTTAVSLNSIATNLVTGIYAANVWFTNQTGGGALGRQFTLLVNEPLVLNGGFETGDFTDWTLSNDNSQSEVVASAYGISPHSGSYFAALGAQNSPGYLSQTLPTAANQSYLLSLYLDSPTHVGQIYEFPNDFSISWNGNALFSQTNIPPTGGWTNLQFIVTATSSSTVLQFGELDDRLYLGLDDVTLTPIPAAAFKSATVVKTNNNLKFAWSALTGLVYQVQFQTNLLQTNWTVLKSITATNTSVTFVDTNPITAFPQKFYRLLLLP
jgi:hypothetical protein